MENIIGEIIELPFKAMDNIITTFLFTPKPHSVQEELRTIVRRKNGQIWNLEREISSLRSSLREGDSNERTLRDQLTKKEAELKRLSEKTKDLENRLLQAWQRFER
jgi:Skp family chaperone for outer membrane proteins